MSTVPQRVQILGVPIDAVTMEEAIARLLSLLSDGKQHHVMTPNSEMLVHAFTDDEFHALLNRTSLNLPDSVGLQYAARWTHQRIPERVAGVDIVVRLMSILTEKYPVFLLGSRPGVAEKAAQILMRINPRLRVVGTFAGTPSDDAAPEIVTRIHSSGAKILLVAYGAPRQDIWIDQHLKNLSNVKLAMGIGGSLDFISGTVRRAPKILRLLGFEWGWRLILQPWRIARIWTAVFTFPRLVFCAGKLNPHHSSS